MGDPSDTRPSSVLSPVMTFIGLLDGDEENAGHRRCRRRVVLRSNTLIPVFEGLRCD